MSRCWSSCRKRENPGWLIKYLPAHLCGARLFKYNPCFLTIVSPLVKQWKFAYVELLIFFLNCASSWKKGWEKLKIFTMYNKYHEVKFFVHFVGRAKAELLKGLAVSPCWDQRAGELDSSLGFVAQHSHYSASKFQVRSKLIEPSRAFKTCMCPTVNMRYRFW
jgi:hypothetical protein